MLTTVAACACGRTLVRFNKTVAAFVAIVVLAAAAGFTVLTEALRLVLLFLTCCIVAVQ